VIVIVAVRERLIGILVDAVSDILTVVTADIRPVPETERGLDQKFLSGLVSFEERMVALLELERLFDLTAAAHDMIAAAA
jgi:purine-binding chemotaxis protein CheW